MYMKTPWSSFLLIGLLVFPLVMIGLPILNENVHTSSNPVTVQTSIPKSHDSRTPDVLPPINENWTKIFGGTQEERIRSGIELADGSLAFCGRTFSRGAGGSDGWFVRTDSGGNVIWDLVFGGSSDDYLISVVECTNGDFVLTGFTSTYGPGDRSVWLMRTDSNANPLWNYTFGGTLEDIGYHIIECTNGDLLISATTQSFSIGDADCWIIRTDSSGNHLWNLTYGSLGLDRFFTAQEVSAGGFIFGGECELNQFGNRDFWLMKTDSSGIEEWNVTFGGVGRDRGVTACEYGSGYAIFGTANYTTGLGDSDYWLIVTNSIGELIWQEFYGGPSIERAQNMIVTNLNGFALFGYSYSYGSGGGDLWLVVTDSNGEILDTFVKGGSLNDYGRSVVQCTNGDFLLTGDIYSFGAGSWDAWLVRVSDVLFEWNPTPVNRIVYVNQNFVYDLDASPEVLIDIWEINDTSHFAIDTFGTITNVTPLALGSYGILARVNSTRGEQLEAEFTVSVLEQPVLIPWTVLVYLDGDNDLEEYAFNDLNSMETIGSTSEVKILVYVDFWEGYDAPFTGARCYEVQQDGNLNLITSPQLAAGLPSEPNMGDWHVLRDFIAFGQTYAPAEHYSLVLWNHGAGAYGLCSDETSDDRLTIAELNQALSDPQVQHLDIVAFDACLMGQLEVAYEIRDAVDLVVFSEEGVPLTGYPYEDILLNLTTFPDATPKALTTSMVYYYVTAYDVGGRYYDPIHNDACLSSIETVKLQTIAQNLDFLAQSLLGSISDPDIYEGVSWARQGTQSFSWASFIDLYSFAENLMIRFPGASMVNPTALNLTLAVQDAVYEEMHLTGVSDAHGLGAVLDSYGSYQLALADDTMWDEFTEAFIDVGSDFSNAVPLLANIGPPESPNLHCGYLDSAYDSVYFVFTPTETGLHSITIDTALPEYSTDFDLYIYDAYQNDLDDSLSGDSAESVAIHLNAGSTYYIEIYSYPSGSEGAGVFYLHVQTPSGPGPLPPNLTILLIAVTFVAIIAGVVAITFFLLRRQSMTAPPPRYTGPSYPPPHSTKVTEAAKFCAYCGSATPQGARYCPVCGASLI